MNDSQRGKLGPWGFWLVAACLVAAAAVAINAGLSVRTATADLDATQAATVHAMGLTDVSPKTLDKQFTDTQGRLLADPPASPDQLADPATLVVAHLESTDAENPSIPWDHFEAHLAEATGRKVEDRPFDNSPDQLAAIKDGKITILALHAADTPFLVNNYGFQPIAVLGNDGEANGNHLDIIVPANSSIARPADLRGHALVCTVPSSITGYRAAVTLLLENVGLRPNVDYSVIWSLGQKRSIQGLAKGEYEAAAVSDDKLQSMLQSNDVAATSYKVIYKSEVIPRTTVGWFYNLKPELADKVRQAILSFEPKAGPDSDATAKPLHFIAIDYKKDFQTVREMDDRFDPRLDAKAKSKQPAAATEPSDPGAG